LKRAGIENFRWHDLRHTWASWHVQQGTPLFALQEMAGWETEKMVRRYTHLAVGHLAVYADNLKLHGTILAQLPPPQKRNRCITGAKNRIPEIIQTQIGTFEIPPGNVLRECSFPDLL
jgi:hypothetical protein